MEISQQRENEMWLQFFTLGYFLPVSARWSEIRNALLSNFPRPQEDTKMRGVALGNEEIQILVTGCLDSKLSECLLDEGFRNVRNFPLSRDNIEKLRFFQNFRDYPLSIDVIKQMREKFVRSRLVRAMFAQFDKESFDVVIDKGGLHALVDPELGPELGNQYLSEVKRVLKHNGRFICLTLAEPCVLGLLFRTFRCGWEMHLLDIPLMSSETSGVLPFVVNAKKKSSSLFSHISFSIAGIPAAEACSFVRLSQECAQEALEMENQIRLQNTCGIQHIKIVHQDTSALMCSLVVDDVKYENNVGIHCLFRSTDFTFRRLTIQRSDGLYQSKALMRRSSELDNTLTVDHNFLANSYNIGIISGFSLISSYLEDVATHKGKVKGLVIGLQAGLLPMFLNKRMSFLDIDVVEPDVTIVNVAKKFFGFSTGENLKVHVTDGIKYVKDVAYNYVADVLLDSFGNKDASVGTRAVPVRRPSKVDILIIDVDYTDSSFGVACPGADLIEESFVSYAQRSLTKQGLFVINLISRSQSTRDMFFSRLKMGFGRLFFLDLEDGANTVFFGLNNEYVDVKGDSGKLSRLLLNPEQSNVALSIQDQDTEREIISSVAQLIQDTAEKIKSFR